MIKRGQAALEFLLTYGWAFMIMIAVIAGFVMFDPLSYSGVSQPTCSSSQLFICEEDRFQVSPRGLIGFTFTNRGPQQLSIQNFSVSRSDIEDYGDVVCETPVTFSPGSTQNMRCEGLEDLVEGEVYEFQYEARVYATSLGEEYTYSVEGVARAPVRETSNLAYLNQTDPSYFTFSVSGGEAALVDYSTLGPRDVVMPDTFEGNPIVGITSSAFDGADLESIEFPSTLKWVSTDSFRGHSLEEVTLPSGFEYVLDSAFRDNDITILSLPESRIQIQRHSFRGNDIQSVNIPDNVNHVGARAFLDNAISSLTLSTNENYNTLRAVAFRRNELTSITIPSNIDTVEARALGQNDITQAVLPASMSVSLVSPHEDALGTNGLGQFYLDNGEQAGTYTYDGSSWTIS